MLLDDILHSQAPVFQHSIFPGPLFQRPYAPRVQQHPEVSRTFASCCVCVSLRCSQWIALHHCSLQDSIPGDARVFFTETEELSNLEPKLERSGVIVGPGATCWKSRTEGRLSSKETVKDERTPSTAGTHRKKTGLCFNHRLAAS